MDLKDAVAIVTGAARGIGRATAVALAEEGAAVLVLVDVKASELKETAEQVRAIGAEVVASETDVTDLASLRAMFDDTEARFGRIDVLHNNAGIGEGPAVWPELSPERSAAIIDVNLRGVVLGTQLALEPMKRSGGGVVVNTSSGAAFAPLPPQAVYAATKAAVVHFTRSCVPLYESHGVRVNAVCPGIVETPMIHESGEGGIAAWLRPFIDSIERLRPEEIAEAVVALVRDDGKIGEVVSVENRPKAQ